MRAAKAIVAVMTRRQYFAFILRNTVAGGSLKATCKPDRTRS
jgi:hypothetical protein